MIHTIPTNQLNITKTRWQFSLLQINSINNQTNFDKTLYTLAFIVHLGLCSLNWLQNLIVSDWSYYVWSSMFDHSKLFKNRVSKLDHQKMNTFECVRWLKKLMFEFVECLMKKCSTHQFLLCNSYHGRAKIDKVSLKLVGLLLSLFARVKMSPHFSLMKLICRYRVCRRRVLVIWHFNPACFIWHAGWYLNSISSQRVLVRSGLWAQRVLVISGLKESNAF